MRNLFISKNLQLPSEKLALIGEFCNFVCDFLSIDCDFEIFLVSNRKDHGISTTAAYYPGNKIVKVYGKNRALVDILRSIAHELTHLKQDEDDMLMGKIQDAGGPIEDEANARAGEMIKRFATNSLNNDQIYENICSEVIR